MKNKIGVVIVHYSNQDDTVELLHCLDKQKGVNYSVYLVDNNVENPFNRRILNKNRFLLLRTGKNLGWAGGAHYGAKIAISQGCEYLCFLTNDTVITDPYFVRKLVIPLNKNSVGATIPVVVYHTSPKLVWSSGGTLHMPFVYTRMNDNGIQIGAAKLNKHPDFGGIGLTMTVSIYNKIGGWDKDYFLYYEDVDICFKIRKIKPILLVNNAVVMHKVSTPSSETTDKLTPFSSYYYGRGVFVFIRKNVPKQLMMIAVISQFIFNAPLFVLSMLKQFNLKALASFFKGSFSGLATLRS